MTIGPVERGRAGIDDQLLRRVSHRGMASCGARCDSSLWHSVERLTADPGRRLEPRSSAGA